MEKALGEMGGLIRKLAVGASGGWVNDSYDHAV